MYDLWTCDWSLNCQIIWFSYGPQWGSVTSLGSQQRTGKDVISISNSISTWLCNVQRHMNIYLPSSHTLLLPSSSQNFHHAVYLGHRVPAYAEAAYLLYSTVVKIRNMSRSAHFTCPAKACVNQGNQSVCMDIDLLNTSRALGPIQNIKTQIQ